MTREQAREAAVDTRDLDYQIGVMQAFKAGRQIESRFRDTFSKAWHASVFPNWNWQHCEYRIKLGDANKMVDTPRTDAAKKIVLGGVGGDWEVVHIAFSRQLERELNAANAEIDRLRKKILQLYEGADEQKQRIKRLEEAGDMMADLLDGGVFMKLAVQWHEAKEAKQ